MDFGTIHGVYTLIFMLAFIGWGIWVFLPRNKKQYDEAASLPLSDVAKSDAEGSRKTEQGE
ncbi:MAG: cbb3-type cytochrome oxidase subunit 3 [Pseudomonadota bacterium]